MSIPGYLFINKSHTFYNGLIWGLIQHFIRQIQTISLLLFTHVLFVWLYFVCNALYGDHSSFLFLGVQQMFQASLSLLRACSPHPALSPLLISVPMASHRIALQVVLIKSYSIKG